MNYFQAKVILDHVREGRDYHEHLISRCLTLTGDLDGYGTHEELRGGGMAGSVQGESTQRWLGISEGVVGKNNP